MAEITFSATLREDGMLAMPDEAIKELGLHPGDPVQVRVEAAEGVVTPSEPKMLDEVLKDLLEEADRLEPQPGKESDDPYERAFGEAVKAKFRRMGFKV